MSDVDPAALFLRVRMKDYLLDALYRLECLEEAHGLASERHDGILSDRLPALETDAEQDAAMHSLEKRLRRIEGVRGISRWRHD